MFRFASLGSGSAGNCLIVESILNANSTANSTAFSTAFSTSGNSKTANKTRLLVDNGFSLKELTQRLARLEISPSEIDGVLVTHEHSDHIKGVATLCQTQQIPAWATYGTSLFFREKIPTFTNFNLITGDAPFTIGDLTILPFSVPHDAREPVQFVFSKDGKKLGVLTDVGTITPRIESVLANLDALFLECNHDLDLLYNSRYPASLKKRIASNLGHLSNIQAAELLAKINAKQLQHLVCAHLSAENNAPELALKAILATFNGDKKSVVLADQENGFTWREIV